MNDASGPRLLETEIERSHDSIFVRLIGELDIATASEVRRAFEAVRNADAQRVLVDLRELTFMESTGLHLLMRLRNDMESEGRELVIVKGPAAVQRLFERTGLDAELPLVDSPEQADQTQP